MSSSAASSGGGGSSLYDTLGVAATATPEEVRKSYRKLVLTCHPDKIRDEALRPEAEKRFQAIVTAYEVLSDAVKRSEYDRRTRANGAESSDVLVNVTLKEALTGATKLAMAPFKQKCAWCAGVGMKCEPCATCAGTRLAPAAPGATAAAPCAARDARLRLSRAVRQVRRRGRRRGVFPRAASSFPRASRRRGDSARRPVDPRRGPRDALEALRARRREHLERPEAHRRGSEGGGFFDVETLRGPETVFVDEGAKTGDVKVIEGKGLPRDGAVGKGDERRAAGKGLKPSGDAERGDHIVRLEVAREKARAGPEPEPEPEPERDGVGGGDEPPAKRAKAGDGDGGGGDAKEMDLAALLAEKKRALLAALEAKSAAS